MPLYLYGAGPVLSPNLTGPAPFYGANGKGLSRLFRASPDREPHPDPSQHRECAVKVFDIIMAVVTMALVVALGVAVLYS